MIRSLSLVTLLVAAACGDNLEVPDARQRDAPDQPVDAAPDGPCATGRYVTGELVDLDSTTAVFMGVNAATFTQRTGTATDMTSPNGRFEMCASSTTSYVFDVDQPTGRPDAIAYLETEAVTQTDRLISFRSWTTVRAATFFVDRGLVYDATKAQVLVFLAGDISNLTFDRSHGTVQSATESNGVLTWSATQTGRYVLFPNVDAAQATGTLTGDTSGTHTIPLEAGKTTFVALHWVFL